MRCCKWFHCVFTHISGDSSACSSVDIRRVEEERGGQECYWYLMSAPTSIHFETQFQIPHTYIVWNPYFDINCSKTSNYRSIKLATMVHFIVYSWNFISGVWTLDRDGRIYRSIINCFKLPCSGVWRAGAEASPLQPRPQVRPRAGGHEAGAPQQAHRWAVGCDWWRAGHVTAVLVSDWSSLAALPAGDWKRFLIKTPPSYDGSFADADLQKFRPDPTPSPLEDPWYGQWLT